MRIVLAAILVAVPVLACAPSVSVPNTPEGGRCVRECMVVFNQCMATTRMLCGTQKHDCLMTCPGATEN